MCDYAGHLRSKYVVFVLIRPDMISLDFICVNILDPPHSTELLKVE